MFLSKCSAFYLISSPASILCMPALVKVGLCSINIGISAFACRRSISLRTFGALSLPVAAMCVNRYLFLFYAASPALVSLAIWFAILMSLYNISSSVDDFSNCTMDRYSILKIVVSSVYAVCITLANIFSLHAFATAAFLLDVLFTFVLALSMLYGKEPFRSHKEIMPVGHAEIVKEDEDEDEFVSCSAESLSEDSKNAENFFGQDSVFDVSNHSKYKIDFSSEDNEMVEQGRRQLRALRKLFGSLKGNAFSGVSVVRELINRCNDCEKLLNKMILTVENSASINELQSLCVRVKAELTTASECISYICTRSYAVAEDAVAKCNSILNAPDGIVLMCFSQGSVIARDIRNIALMRGYIREYEETVEYNIAVLREDISRLYEGLDRL